MSIVYLVILVSFCESDIQPTNTTSTAGYFIASKTARPNLFSNGLINCTFPQCYVICDESLSCKNTTINVTISQKITVNCSNSTACNKLKLYGSPISTTINCIGPTACASSSFHVNNGENVYFNSHSTNIQYASSHVTLYANKANSVVINSGYYGCLNCIYKVSQ
eukprot:212952_1